MSEPPHEACFFAPTNKRGLQNGCDAQNGTRVGSARSMDLRGPPWSPPPCSDLRPPEGEARCNHLTSQSKDTVVFICRLYFTDCTPLCLFHVGWWTPSAKDTTLYSRVSSTKKN